MLYADSQIEDITREWRSPREVPQREVLCIRSLKDGLELEIDEESLSINGCHAFSLFRPGRGWLRHSYSPEIARKANELATMQDLHWIPVD